MCLLVDIGKVFTSSHNTISFDSACVYIYVYKMHMWEILKRILVWICIYIVCGHTSKCVTNLLAKHQCVFWSAFFKFSFYFGRFSQHEKGCTGNNLNESKIGARLAM